MKDAEELWCCNCKFTHSLWPGLQFLSSRGAHCLFSPRRIYCLENLDRGLKRAHIPSRKRNWFRNITGGFSPWRQRCTLWVCVQTLCSPRISQTWTTHLRGKVQMRQITSFKSSKLGINNNKGLPLEMSTFKLFTVANLHY